MLAPSVLPNEYRAWNQKHMAPFGPRWWIHILESRLYGRFASRVSLGRIAWQKRMSLPYWLMRRMGPFAFQRNSRTRAFEYPWCYHATTLARGMQVAEIGAGASGFQFVLAESGLNVVSVDPIMNPSEIVDWTFSWTEWQRLKRAFGPRVKLIQDFFERAQLESGDYDRIFAISVLEHVPEDKVFSMMREAKRILKSGGFFIVTIDLFLDCYPFTGQIANQFGRNISVRRLVEESGLLLRTGRPCQLYGYAEFDLEKILTNKDSFLIANNVMTQCLVLQKPIG